MTPFLSFWGKARPPQGAAARWHPVALHCLDVAAVAEAFLLAQPAGAKRIATLCGWDHADFIRNIVFLIALHDIGKFSKPFQAKAKEHWPPILGEYIKQAGPAHGAIGLRLLAENEAVHKLFPGWADEPLEALLCAVAGHHGRPVQRPPLGKDIVCAECSAAGRTFLLQAAALLGPVPLAAPPEHAAEAASWWLAGLTTLCDWTGSSTHWFDYKGDGFASLAQYWPTARAGAASAIVQSGLLPAASAPARGLAGLMPHIKTPTPMQALAEVLTLPDGPVSIVVEDATGGGKTEAALLLAHRLIADGRADGLFIALPTMATADAMFDRLAESYRRLFAGHARPSLALAHGRATLNDLFQGSILPASVAASDLEEADEDETASIQCAAWLAEERRRVFFAHVGVGTIDQALLSVLTARYAALRLFGLSRKVLVVDEAHAYDPYMSEELDRLLTFHAMLGGSSIILSATLPHGRRAALLKAVATGLGATPYLPSSTNYPLVTVTSGQRSFECHAAMREVLQRDLRVRRLASVAEAVEAIAKAARAGACAIWIRNTVDDARAGAEALRQAGIEPILFHARFAMGDRLTIQKNVLDWFGKNSRDRAPGGIGRVLVATQVVEQSLDLDADVMVTDLAPIELLIQRAGRLQRHPKRDRPPGCKPAELLVVSPDPVALPGHDWAEDAAIGGSRFVYPVHVLWLSARVLFAAGSICVPTGVRALVEAVYGDEAELPPGLWADRGRADGNGIAQKGQARANLLEPRKGYRISSGQWESDIVMPTRLGDDYVTFRLAREEAGMLVPWYADDEPARAWALSEIALRRSIADGQAVPARLAAALDRMGASWKTWQRDIPVLVMLPGETEGWTSEALRKNGKVLLGYDKIHGLNLIR